MINRTHGVIHVSGLRITPLSFAELCDALLNSSADQLSRVVGHLNLHGIYLANRNPKMRRFYNALATQTYIDGSSVILLSRLRKLNLTMDQCVTFVDKFEPFMAEAAKRSRKIFYLGSTEEAVQAMAARMREKHPDLSLTVHNGYFPKDAASSTAVIDLINQAKPDLLMVGFGMPIQEHWVLENHARIQVPVITTVGATADYVAGAIAKPPEWAGRLGLYWLFRLVSEPRRLWRRYLVEPWSGLFSFVRWGDRQRPD